MSEAQNIVQVERGRVWINVGVRAFMLDYEPDNDEDAAWYAEQLSDALASFTPDVKTQQAQAPGWQLSRVSDGDIRVYGPNNETWLIRKDCGEGFYDFIHRYFDAAIGTAPQQGAKT